MVAAAPALLLAAAVVCGDPTPPPAAAAPPESPYRVDRRLLDARLLALLPDRLDASVRRGADPSLYLRAHEPDSEYFYFRVPEVAVVAGVRYRLHFHYLIAAGGDPATYFVRVSQYSETPKAWKALTAATIERPLSAVGRWVEVAVDFTADTEATACAVDFRIVGPGGLGVCCCAELWVSDGSFRPVGTPVLVGP